MTQNDDCLRWRTALKGTQNFETKFVRGDLDEMIDFQNLKSRDLSYFSRNFLELVMHGYTILNGGDLDENGNSKGEN